MEGYSTRETTQGRSTCDRRRFLRSAAVSGIAVSTAFSGCLDEDDGDDPGLSGDGEDDDDDVTEDTPDDPGEVDTEFIYPVFSVPEEKQFNPFNPTRYGWETQRIQQEPLAGYHIPAAEYRPRAIDSWEFDDDGNMELTVWDELEWVSGEAYTAEDVRTTLMLNVSVQDDPIGDFVEEFEVVDDTTLVLRTDGEVNPQVLEALALNGSVDAPAHIFGEYVDRIEDGEEDEAVEELVEWELDPEEADGLGPFWYVEADTQELRTDRRDEHPNADAINFPHFGFRHFGSNEGQWAAMSTDEIDGSHAFTPEDVVNGFPDYVEMALMTDLGGFSVVYNHDREPWDQREVRQAIAHVVDSELVAENMAGPYGLPVGYPSGVLDTDYDHWLSDIEDDLESYPIDHERAAELLEEAGFSQDGDEWVDDGGEALTIELKVPAGFSDWLAGSETVVALLNEFGIQTDLVSPDVTTYWGQDYPNADFDLGTVGWTRGQAYPWFNLEYLLEGGDAQDVWGYREPGEEVTYESPYDGEVTRDPTELLEQLARTPDEQEELVLTHELVSIVNQDLPVLALQEKLLQAFLNGRDFAIDLPEEDDDWGTVILPQFWYARQGRLIAREDGE